MKRIVICCDGTWNTPDKQENGVPIATNVVKLAEAVRPKAADGMAQLMYYDPGVGTSGGWFKRIYDGATGAGLSRNILEAYRYLIRNYEPGDELFFFGFSRGAYTARSLAGLIRNSGILKLAYPDMVGQAFKLYRKGGKSTHPAQREATLFRHTYSVSNITPIKFIGVWDTVGSLGNPLLLNGILSRHYHFHDTDLSSTVDHAFQALAIDEKRRHFKATLWHKQDNTDEQREKRGRKQKQELEQVWFVGVHSNVGGGYSCSALSDIALRWMWVKAYNYGLNLDPSLIFTQPEPLQPPDESRKGLYRLISPFYRPIAGHELKEKSPMWYRVIKKLYRAMSKVLYGLMQFFYRLVTKPEPERGQTYESLHPTVLQWYQQNPSYRPKNLEDYIKRFPERKPSSVQPAAG